MGYESWGAAVHWDDSGAQENLSGVASQHGQGGKGIPSPGLRLEEGGVAESPPSGIVLLSLLRRARLGCPE